MLGPTRPSLTAALGKARPYLQGASPLVKGMHMPPTSHLRAGGDWNMEDGPRCRAGVTERAGIALWKGKSLGVPVVEEWVRPGCQGRALMVPHCPPHSCAELKGHPGPSCW